MRQHQPSNDGCETCGELPDDLHLLDENEPLPAAVAKLTEVHSPTRELLRCPACRTDYALTSTYHRDHGMDGFVIRHLQRLK